MKGWKNLRLKEFCEFKYGKNLPEHSRVKGLYPVYGSSSVISYHNQFLVKGPGIIVGRKGTVGKVQFSKSDFFPIDTTFFIEAKEGVADIKFLYYRLSLCGLEDMNSDAAVPGLNRDAASSLKILLPPLPTQKKIAGILSAYDDAIENNLRRIKLLEEMAQITYEEWFVRLRFPGHTTTPINEATGLPEGWGYGSLGDLVEFQNGYAFKGGDFKNEGFPVIKIKNIGGNTVDIKDTDFVDSEVANLASKFKLDEGDLLIAMTGATIGKTGFLPFSSKPCYLNQRVGKFLRKKDGNNIHYIFAVIGGDRGLQQVLGLASGAAQPNISGNQILSLKCTVPSKEILSKYSLLMQSNFDLILGFVRQNQRLREARDILLPRLMTGVIDAEKYQPEKLLKEIA